MTAVDFEDDHGGSPSDFNRWIVPALVLSVALHLLFWIWARSVLITDSHSEAYYERVAPRAFHVERVEIDENLLEPEPADDKRQAMAPRAVDLPVESASFEKLMADTKGEPP